MDIFSVCLNTDELAQAKKLHNTNCWWEMLTGMFVRTLPAKLLHWVCKSGITLVAAALGQFFSSTFLTQVPVENNLPMDNEI